MRITVPALLASVAMSTIPAFAQDFGTYGLDTMTTLALDYPGRYTGSTVFPRSADYMADRLSYNNQQASRQNFDTSRGASQNIIVTQQGINDRFIVVGAHFDSAGQYDDLQAVDDNASGAGLLSEVAAHMSGLQTETGLVFAGFGAEEIGLKGSVHYVDTLTSDQRMNIAGMINIDSLITGDFMYAHAGSNYLDNPELKSLWTRIHAIADELEIDLRSNPGLNPHYPIDTGCCSDAAPFEPLDIPILWLEATNWEIGDLDGYTQTENPLIPGGSTWHDPTEDNFDVLTAALGEDRFQQRLTDYSRILTRLLAEETGADLLASAMQASGTAAQMADLTTRHQDNLSDLGMQSVRTRLDSPAALGIITPNVAVQGLVMPDGSADFGQDDSSGVMVQIGASFQATQDLSFGGNLAYGHNTDDLIDGTDMTAKGLQASLDLGWKKDANWVLASVSYGTTDLSGNRDFDLISGLGATIVSRDFTLDTDARTLGARVQAGHDIQMASGLQFGPVVGLDYSRTRIDGFSEGGDRRAISYDEQDYESLEVQLGGQVGRNLRVGTRIIALQANAAYIRELADGAPDALTLTDGTGITRKVALDGQDKSFGRIGLSAGMDLSPRAQSWLTVQGRVGHDAGGQVTVGAGLGMRF